MLYEVVKEFSWSTAKFLRKVSNHSVTFARICYQRGKLIPWNNNLIERLMGELSKRIKHKWMHWSTRRLEAIANLILLRYTEGGRDIVDSGISCLVVIEMLIFRPAFVV